jgi:hypothetical protein
VEKKGVEERKLPGLDLTHNQLFFLSFAQVIHASQLAKAQPDLAL